MNIITMDDILCTLTNTFGGLHKEELSSNNKPRTHEFFKQGVVGTTDGYSTMKTMKFEKFRSY